MKDRIAGLGLKGYKGPWLDEIEREKKIPKEFDMRWNEYLQLGALADYAEGGSRKAILIAYSLGYLRSKQARRYENSRKSIFGRLLRKGE